MPRLNVDDIAAARSIREARSIEEGTFFSAICIAAAVIFGL